MKSIWKKIFGRVRARSAAGKGTRAPGRADEHASDFANLLHDAEARTSLILDAAADCIVVLDNQGRIKEANRAALEMAACDSEFATGRHIGEVLGKSVLLRGEQYKELLTRGFIRDVEKFCRLPDGREIPISFSMSVLRDVSGKATDFVCVAKDLTARVRTEEELRQTNQTLETIIQASPLAIITLDAEGRVQFWNQAAKKILGWSIFEVLNKPYTTLAGADVEEFWQAYERALCGESGLLLETQHLRKDGAQINVSISFAPLGNGGQSEQEMMLVLSDITERKRIEEKLRENEGRLRDLFDNTSDLIQNIAPDGRYIYVNRAWRETLGYTEEEMSRLTMMEVVHPARLPHCMTIFSRLMSGEKIEKVESVFVTKDGRAIEVEGSISVRFEDGRPVSTRGIFRDVTERNRTERALRAREQQQSAIVRLSSFALRGLPLDRLFAHTTRIVAETLDVEMCKVLELLPGEEEMILRAGVGWPAEAIGTATVSTRADSQEGYTLRTSMPVIVKDLETETRFNAPLLLSEQGVRSGMSVVIHGHERPFGVLGVHTRRLVEFMPEDASFLQAVADLLATSLERERTQKLLRDSEELFRQIAENVREVFWVTSANFERVHYVSQVYEEVWGRPCAELYKRPAVWVETIHEDDRALVFEVVEQHKRGERPLDVECRIVRPNGEVRWIHARGFTVAGRDDAPGRVAGIAEDITERKQSAEAILHSEERYRKLFHSNPQPMFVYDTETLAFLDVNDTAVRNYGYTREEFLAMTIRDIRPPEDVPALLELIGQTNGTVDNLPGWRHRQKDGTLIDVQVSAHQLDYEGRQARMVLAVDVTEARRAEAERTALAQIGASVINTSNLDELFTLAHQRINERIPARNCIVVLLDHATGLLHYAYWVDDRDSVPEPRPLGAGLASYVIHTGQPLLLTGDAEERIFAQTGITRVGSQPASWIGVPLRTLEHIIGTLIVQDYERANLYGERDVAFLAAVGDQLALAIERKRMELALVEARDAALASARLKSEFLANMSHEIRTPMNGIVGMTELALSTELTTEQEEYLQMVKSSADALLTVINDILDFSKIEAGRLDLDVMPFDVRGLLSDTLKPLYMRAGAKGIELACEVAPEVPDAVTGDPGRLRQIIINLVGNALKFTEEGEVLVRVLKESEAEGEVCLRFEVRDTGIGIPADKQKLIFESFTQADGTTTRRYGGTGLGLSISQRLVEMMGGTISVESTEGAGSTFAFSARFAVREERSAPPAEIEPFELRGVRALVVDDNQANRRVLEGLLTMFGMRPATAESGRAALSELEQAVASSDPFKIVLLDVCMAEMDGFELAEKIHARSEFAGTRLLMLTSAGQRGDAARCKEVGISAYLTKPILRDELRAAVLHVFGQSARDGAEQELITRHVLKGRGRNLNILLAEDNLVNQALATRLLEKRGHTVAVAANGREALDALDTGRFDVVLMDVQMPGMNGFEATRLIREREALSGGHQPIIAMTAHAMAGDRERCLEAGMDDYVSKPINISELVGAIDAQLSAHYDDAPKAPRLTCAVPTEPFDRRSLLEQFDGDTALLAELAGHFAGECACVLGEMRAALAGRDDESLMRLAHSLKGMALNFHAGATADAAARLEASAKEGRLDEAPAALEDLAEKVERLLPALSLLEEECAR